MSSIESQASTLTLAANAYSALGDTRRAIEFYEQALAIAREIGDKRHEGNSLGNLGNAYSDLGDTRRAIEFYERALAIAREIGDKRSEGADLGNLGSAYGDLGDTRRAIEFYERALAIAREIGDKRGEGNRLGNLGNRYAELGDTRRAIEFYEQALAIDREIGDKRGEATSLDSLGNRYANLGMHQRAIEFYHQALAINREIGNTNGESFDLNNSADVLLDQNKFDEAIESFTQAIRIADEIGLNTIQNYGRWGLALAHLYAAQADLTGFANLSGLNDDHLATARAAAETARKFDVPENNHNVAALLGIIALRQAAINPKGPLARDPSGLGDAQQSFTTAIAQADALLAQTSELYDALDAKGIALCGLGLIPDPKGFENPLGLAVDTFRAARKINRDPGIVSRVVRLLDALALAAPDGAAVLADARKAAGGE